MEFHEWEPVYEAILADLGYDRAGDERSRDLLAELLDTAETFDIGELDWSGRRVAVAGDGPSLAAETELAATADVVVATSGAATLLRSRGVAIDCVVTDLDTNPDAVVDWTDERLPVAVHAHGDNTAAIREYVPQTNTSAVIPTTQANPRPPVRNFGGFTDGDRAAFLADALGADSLVFPGWDFDDGAVTAEKRAKLAWAERLLYWLERRRNDSFTLLDGRRDDIEMDELLG